MKLNFIGSNNLNESVMSLFGIKSVCIFKEYK